MRVALLTTGRHDVAALDAIAKHLPDAIWCRYPAKLCSSDMEATSHASGCMGWVAAFLHQHPVDALLVIGDRSETLAACVAAVCMKVKIIHVHGGEITTGAIDNVCRDAISQLASIHFVAHEEAASRLRYMGVHGDIYVSGAPALDLMLAKRRDRVPGKDIVFCYHPETLSNVPVLDQIKKAASVALTRLPPGGKIICVGVNPDAGGVLIKGYLDGFGDPFVVRPNLSADQYWDLLATCHCLVGNSSSGVIEAPSLGVEFVETGNRQGGRARCFYGDGHAGERIAKVLQPPASSP